MTMPAIGGLEPGWGLTVLRVAMGLVFATHGYAKFAAGLGKASVFFAKVSIPLPELTGPLIAVLELVGGILLVLGWATRWLGLLFAIEMLVATFWVQVPAKGWNGSELERMLLAGGITLLFGGAGKLAIDQLWPKKWV
jgi:putative oxidoreductase